ncbi:MAG: N-acetyltransferase [Halioglobus sp.]|nr:N-acetyltransferase [Halioglobus sp.]
MTNTINPATLTAEFLTSIDQIPAAQWDGVAGTDYPFLRHTFLYGLEKTDCTTAATGWQPCHLLLRRGGVPVAVMPLYLKSHSYGEYVFDWSWADAWRQSGLDYYPKLLTAIPFTPATGPRLCVATGIDENECLHAAIAAVKDLATRRNISSWHLLFPTESVSEKLLEAGLHRRAATQFHWFNNDYQCFDDFLATFNSRKRKSLNRERRRVAEQSITLKTLTGAGIGREDWEQFYHFYQLTYAKRSGHGGYLSRAFFVDTAASMGDQVVMVLACLDDRAVAGALYFRSSDTLYGRYWGCEREYDCLHFEACYYQGIEYCIANKLQRFDPGAQGEHKIQRGFRPITTWSNHWIADPQLSAAVGDFTRREALHNEQYRQAASGMLPFK